MHARFLIELSSHIYTEILFSYNIVVHMAHNNVSITHLLEILSSVGEFF